MAKGNIYLARLRYLWIICFDNMHDGRVIHIWICEIIKRFTKGKMQIQSVNRVSTSNVVVHQQFGHHANHAIQLLLLTNLLSRFNDQI